MLQDAAVKQREVLAKEAEIQRDNAQASLAAMNEYVHDLRAEVARMQVGFFSLHLFLCPNTQKC